MGCYDPITQTKVYSRCRETKPVSDFYPQRKHGKDPYAAICKSYEKAKYKAWADKNHDRKMAYMGQWYEENVAHVKAYDAKRWRDPKVQARAAAIKAENRVRYNSYYHNYRAKKAAAEGTYSDEDIARIFRDQKGKCAVCRKSIKRGYHVDHIKPLSKGGTNWPANLQLTCMVCNVSKADTDPIKFMQRLGRLL